MASAERSPGLTVAITGPTGDIGRSVVRALERSREVGRIIGMARRPFDPADHGWKRTEYRQGDVLDRASVDELVADADVVVHLAFLIFGSHDETREVNLRGSRNVFEATVAARAKRLVYTSSVAAYGFHRDNPDVLTEDTPPLGTPDFYYSAQKAELERLLQEIAADAPTDVYVFRPCIVAGSDAPTLIEGFTGQKVFGRNVRHVWRLLEALPIISPVLPDAGVPFQLVHHDDVASAVRAAVLGRGTPGTYNLAADDAIRVRDVAQRPRLAVRAGSRRRARRARRGRLTRARGAGRGGMGGRPAQARADGHRQGAARAALAGATRRAGNARGDRRGGPRSQHHLAAGSPNFSAT